MKGRRASGTVPGAGLQQADALNQDECCCLLPLHLPSKQWSQPSPWANLQEFCGSKTDREQGDPAQPCCSPSHVRPCKASLKEPSPPASLLGMLGSLRTSVGCSSILPPHSCPPSLQVFHVQDPPILIFAPSFRFFTLVLTAWFGTSSPSWPQNLN